MNTSQSTAQSISAKVKAANVLKAFWCSAKSIGSDFKQIGSEIGSSYKESYELRKEEEKISAASGEKF